VSQTQSVTLFEDVDYEESPSIINSNNTNAFKVIDHHEPDDNDHALFKNISLFSTVRIEFIDTSVKLTLQLVKYKPETNEKSNGVQRICVDSALGMSLLGKKVGDIIKIINTDKYVQIIELVEG
jgi:transcription elongation GreA/GreB family factor